MAVPGVAIAIRPTPHVSPALARNLERNRVLRTNLMLRLAEWRARPLLAWLEGRPKSAQRWCDVPTAVLINGFGALVGKRRFQRADGRDASHVGLVTEMAKFAAIDGSVDREVAHRIIQHLSELVERERLLRPDTDAARIASYRAQHRLRKAHRDVKKGRIGEVRGWQRTPDSRWMPHPLSPDQAAHIEAAFARRNQLLEVT